MMKTLAGKLLICLAICVTLIGCTSEKDVYTATHALGLTDVEPGGHAWFACSDDDSFATKFTAKNDKGETVSGAVCSGFMKGATVRFD